MRMHAYDFDVIYRPGESNMSDYLSRHPEEYLSFIAYHDVP